MTAGLDVAQGDLVVPIDVDLQEPPELILEMVQKWKEGFDVVVARRQLREGDSFLKRITAKGYYALLKRLSPIDIPSNVGDFRLMDRQVVEVLKQYREKKRFMKGIFATLGFKTAEVAFNRVDRAAGTTKWSYLRLIGFAIDGLLSFSVVPLQISAVIGSFVSFGAFCYAVFLIIKVLFFGIAAPGYASIMVVMLFLGGIQMLSLGILGEYIGSIYYEVKGRPIYIVKETTGLEGPSPSNRNLPKS